MSEKGHTVNGTSEICSVGAEALEALAPFVKRSLGENAEVAEIDIRENMSIMATIGTDFGFTTYTWTRERWVEVT